MSEIDPLLFVPYGPFDVPTRTLPNGHVIDEREIREFWADLRNSELGAARGVYVFALRAGPGYTPYYVGKAARQSFAQECFTSDKLKKYNLSLAHQTGRPVLSLIAHPAKRGRVNQKAIGSLELELIQSAYFRNPNLMNKCGIEIPKYGVSGVLRSGPGKPSNDAIELKRILGLEERAA